MDDWVQKHPKETLLEILQQAHKEEPQFIGPPYAIVHIISEKSKPPKIKWISKGKCPGWSESVDEEHSLVQLREKLRKQEGPKQ